MTISQSSSVRSLGGAEGGEEGTGTNQPLLGASVRNSREEINTGHGQAVEAAEVQDPNGCLGSCMRWLRHCFEATAEAAAEAEVSVAVAIQEPEGATGSDEAKAEKAKKTPIPKPDSPGEAVDLTTLDYDRLNAWSVEKAIDIATGALENTRQTACYEYWAYKDQPKPRDPTKVREALRVFLLVINLVRSFIAQKTETATAITKGKLAPLGVLAEQCLALHAQIEKKLGKSEDSDAAEAAAPQVGAEPPLGDQDPAEEAGGDDAPQVGDQDPAEEAGDDAPQVGAQDPTEEAGGGDDEPQVDEQDPAEEGGDDIPQVGDQDPPEETGGDDDAPEEEPE